MESFCGKLIEGITIKMKSQCQIPELDKYCGCCSLKTGILIRSIFGALLNIAGVIANCTVIAKSMSIVTYLYHTDIAVIQGNYGSDISAESITNAIMGHKIVISYLMTWMMLKWIHTISFGLAIYGVCKDKPTYLKLYLYINIPNWIFDSILSTLGAFIYTDVWMKMVLLFTILSEGYNLLAVNSEYRRMTGKSRLMSNSEINFQLDLDQNYPNGFVSPPHRNFNLQITCNDQPHCPTCTCNFTSILENVNSETQTSPTTEQPTASESTPQDTVNTLNDEEKVLNFKEDAIIFDQNQLVPGERSTVERTEIDAGRSSNERKEKCLNFKDEPIIFDQNQLLQTGGCFVDRSASRESGTTSSSNTDNVSNNRALKPTTLVIQNKTEILKDMDVPVIYDENQLNQGSSPVFEDKKIGDNAHEVDV